VKLIGNADENDDSCCVFSTQPSTALGGLAERNGIAMHCLGIGEKHSLGHKLCAQKTIVRHEDSFQLRSYLC
jgi:hypothetical protein